MSSLSPKERIFGLIKGKEVDRPAIGSFAMGFIARQVYDLSLRDCYTDWPKFLKSYIKVQEMYGFDSPPLVGHASMGAGEFGGRYRYPSEGSNLQSPAVVDHPVKSVEDVYSLELPNPREAGEIPGILDGVRYVRDNYPPGYDAVSVVVGSPFTWAGNIADVNNLMMWIIDEPEAVHELQEKVVDFLIEYLKVVLEVGGEVVMPFDGGPTESNDLVSPSQFKEFVLPHWIDFRERALELGIPGFLCHPCGNQTKNLKHYSELPGTLAINFDYRTPLQDVVDTLGKQSMIVGSIEPTRFISETEEWIYKKSLEQLEIAAHSPHGYMIGPGCELPVDTPPLNFHMMGKAVHDYAKQKY
ncbi:Methylcobalamin:coenzyme M methyltransferase MtbA [Methanonatronarchaeum thermophilum]|uniref:Methylcobalamin:coenzyme M methyltransferase MtbA n=1 Tax=Methanonatronarchaeum thermophilum TaxID=1927129 RepID=A0A1Y3GEP9_9EURY|nr:uroporphyrinogen decarboxylase family protein [Methanonatronarchaeum thermophilum]OUJ18783.1 Methylcobalamin:coenzyme M methyltransferase MtbA [Methanonatronarchaeum thermophilum]